MGCKWSEVVGLFISCPDINEYSFFFSFFFLNFSGGCEWSSDAGPQAARQTRRPGAHVHQHQQRPVHPQRGLHTWCEGWQLLWIPAQTVDPGRQDGRRVILPLFCYFILWCETTLDYKLEWQIIIEMQMQFQRCCFHFLLQRSFIDLSGKRFHS